MLVLTCLVLLITADNLRAGGSGFNVVIVVNQNSTNSVQLGNYYRELRQVPPQNFLRINWAGANTEWSTTDYTNTLLNPLLAMLASRKLTNQVDYVLLSMDIPYRINGDTNNDGDQNSTTSALFYGFINDPHDLSTCEVASNSASLYVCCESIFRATPPAAGSNFFLATMITASNLSVAEMVVHQGVISDGTFPTQTVWLGKSSDPARNVRYPEFDNTVFDTRLRGNYTVLRTNLEGPAFNGLILGYQNGSYSFGVDPIPLFVPGAMADNLTSFGGQIFEDTAGQTTLLKFASAGVAGSYGTINEPCNYLQKFPDSQNYFYQSRGFSLAECYYQSLTNVYEGLVYGEPLAAPFAQPGRGAWTGLATNAVLAGTTNLAVQFNASDAGHPVQQVDLFLDGFWLQTVTNIAPQSGNFLSVTLNGFGATYSVPANATIKSVTSNLVGELNGTTYKANTKVSAYAHGDRIELQSTAAYTKTGAQISVAVTNGGVANPITTQIQTDNATPTNFLDSVASGFKVYMMTGTLLANSSVQLTVTKTNGTQVTVTVNNNGSTTLTQFALQLLTAVSNTVALQGADGIQADDLQTDSSGNAYFNLYARGSGYAAAQITAAFSPLSTVVISPAAASTLTDNVNDLQPREHLYVTAGVTNLALNIPLVTTSLADGYHELDAVAYEGSHVRTQTRATQNIIVKNTALSATFTALLSGTNSSPQPALQFTVIASTNNISTIQLFSTGGLLAAATNQSAATFSVNLPGLDVGLHPFYAIVTDNAGHQYRTQTQSVRLISVGNNGTNLLGVDYPFPLTFNPQPLMLFWPATAGRSYTILSTTNVALPFLPHAVVVPTTSLGEWTETNTSPAQQFYRVSVTP